MRGGQGERRGDVWEKRRTENERGAHRLSGELPLLGRAIHHELHHVVNDRRLAHDGREAHSDKLGQEAHDEQCRTHLRGRGRAGGRSGCRVVGRVGGEQGKGRAGVGGGGGSGKGANRGIGRGVGRGST